MRWMPLWETDGMKVMPLVSVKKYGWHFYQYYGRASQESPYASEVNTKHGIVPVNDTEMITYVGGGIWDVR